MVTPNLSTSLSNIGMFSQTSFSSYQAKSLVLLRRLTLMPSDDALENYHLGLRLKFVAFSVNVTGPGDWLNTPMLPRTGRSFVTCVT